jgi:hypothetical protein
MSILKKVTSLIIVFLIAHIIPVVSRAISGSFNLYAILPLRQLIFAIISYLV